MCKQSSEIKVINYFNNSVTDYKSADQTENAPSVASHHFSENQAAGECNRHYKEQLDNRLAFSECHGAPGCLGRSFLIQKYTERDKKYGYCNRPQRH